MSAEDMRAPGPVTDGGQATVTAGIALPEVTRTLTTADLVAYAGATWDWYRTHYDAEAIAEAHLPGPIVDGQMFGALLAAHAQDWSGPSARIRAMSFRFASMVFAGDTIRILGRVGAVEEHTGHLRVTVEQQILVGERPAVAPARTVLEVPR